MFSVPSAFKVTKSSSSARQHRHFASRTKNAFSLAFHNATVVNDDFHCDLNADELLSCFNTICGNVLDLVAPPKAVLHKPTSEPCRDDTVRSL